MRIAARNVSAVIATLALLTVGGAGASASAATEPIRIGAVFSETGGFSSIGSPGLAGMRLAAAQINARAGVLGRRVKLVAADAEPGAIRRALAATRGFPMTTGTLSYAPGRRIPVKPVAIVRVQDGRPAFYRAVTPR